MKKTETRAGRLGLLFLSAALSAGMAVLFLPSITHTKAGGRNEKTGTAGDGRSDAGLPNYDIRLDTKSIEKLAAYRTSMNRSASDVADIRGRAAAAEVVLKSKRPAAKIEYSRTMQVPEIIAPDVLQGRAALTDASAAKRQDILKGFLKQNRALVGVASPDVDGLHVVSDYSDPDGNLSFAELEQHINGIPVFQGRVKAGFTRSGEMVRMINNLAPEINELNVTANFGDPAAAVNLVRGFLGETADNGDLTVNPQLSSDNKIVYGDGSSAVAEKVYFPTEPGVATAAWRVLAWGPERSYYAVVDAVSGTLLWRKCITDEQSQPATYNVYANPNAMMNVARSPFPMSPGQTSPNGVQAAGISRSLVTLVGNEPPYNFNNLGWITDGANTTDGNNVQAGLDRESPNQGRATDIDPNGVPAGTGRVFNFPFTPGIPTNPALNGGDSPLPAGQSPSVCQATGTATAPTDFQKASTTQLFYIANRYHDELYRLGFTEQAGNFQSDNFLRGGVGGDRVSAQAQDCLGTNNANFSTPPDGFRPTMQMYLWTLPTPDFDGSLDADIVVHELTHGLSNRLHGNASGLNLDIARGMGEGWSDFFALSLLSQESDPINAAYPMSGYATYPRLNFGNYYYGIRRFPYAVMSFTGGPQNRPHNPLTFADIDSTTLDLSDGAFLPATSGTPDAVHRAGEIWCSALWEVRARFIQRLGWAVGNRRVLQFVIDGMKLAPIDPTFLTERDAILSAAIAGGTAADVADIWAGFAIRGIGASASIQVSNGTTADGSGTGTTRVTQSFDLPNVTQSPAFVISDAAGDNDGAVEPGEQITITVPLTNSTGIAATGVTLQVTGGITADYGTINHNSTVTRQLTLTVPATAQCGGFLDLTLNINSSLGPVTIKRSIPLGAPKTTYAENFDGVTAPAFPTGWVSQSVQSGIAFKTVAVAADTAPNMAFAEEPSSTGGGTDLTSPAIPITAPAATLSFRSLFQTERSWDGGVLEVSIAGGAFQDILAAGGSFIQNGYNGSLGGGANNPLAGRSAWTGDSGGYITSIVRLPPSAAGKSIQLRFRFGADDNTAVLGWQIDTVQVAGEFVCSVAQQPNKSRARADFDGDGKTDLSVFRPSDNNWYVVLSNGGMIVRTWGIAGDQLTPGDFDGDGKTDTAVFRPSESKFYTLNSNGFVFTSFTWGVPGDNFVAGDYDGDGAADAAVFRPSDNNWYVRRAGGSFSASQFGNAGDIPVRGDYDGDGKTDLAIYRGGQWWIAYSNGSGLGVFNWGVATDKPVPADYDGDGKDDIAVYRPSEGKWYIRRSTNNQFDVISWGEAADIPAPGDYDGDGKADVAIFRDGTWYIIRSTAGIFVGGWGVAGDVPIPSKYLP